MQLNLNPDSDALQALRQSGRGRLAILEFLRHRDSFRYRAWREAIGPVLKAAGGRVVWSGRPDQVLIGGEDPGWNEAVLTHLPSSRAYLRMLVSAAYREAVLQRDATVERLESLALKPWPRRAPVLARLVSGIRAWRVPKASPPLAEIQTSGRIDASVEQLETLRKAEPTGPIVMINFLAFRERAVYAEPVDDADVSGSAAYARYGDLTAPLIARVGGRVLWSGRPRTRLVGEPGEWESVVLVRYPSRTAYLRMIQRSDYQLGTRHRDAGLERTELIVTTPR